MSPWIRGLFAGLRPGRRPRRSRPALEDLESRNLLSGYRQTNLISDLPGHAKFVDRALKNPWGLAASPQGPWWVADNGTGKSTIYSGGGSKLSLVVTVPSTKSGETSTPTGIVFNGNTNDFKLHTGGKTGSSVFIFATEGGTIAGWNPSGDATKAVVVANRSASGAVYKGLAITADHIYATNFHAGTVDVYDKNFHLVHLAGSFTDPTKGKLALPKGYAPFGIQEIKGRLYVTYAKQDADKEDDVKGAGHGFIDVFDNSGHFIRRFASGGALNSPWGLAVAPSKFGAFSGDLLVGNFGDGTINAYNPTTHKNLGHLKDAKGHVITISGLWDLEFGNGAMAGAKNTLFFTAGIRDEADGLFGALTTA